jgi:hypothetical protein
MKKLAKGQTRCKAVRRRRFRALELATRTAELRSLSYMICRCSLLNLSRLAQGLQCSPRSEKIAVVAYAALPSRQAVGTTISCLALELHDTRNLITQMNTRHLSSMKNERERERESHTSQTMETRVMKRESLQHKLLNIKK